MAADFSGSGILPPPHPNAERSHSDAEIAAAIAEMQAGTVEMVETGHRKTYIIGTAHLSNESAEDARRLIELVEPDAVLVELCDQRAGMLTITKEQFNHGDMPLDKLIEVGPTTMPHPRCRVARLGHRRLKTYSQH